MNQPFGDVVSWDLIPRVAISSLTLMPGSNPLFGLNTLGGALSLVTKDGVANPGSSVQVRGGSHGLAEVEFESGGSQPNGLDWYAAGDRFHSHGWRDASPSDVGQLFGKLGWRDSDDPRVALGIAGRQRPDRQRPAGAAPAGARPGQHLHLAGHDQEPVADCSTSRARIG